MARPQNITNGILPQHMYISQPFNLAQVPRNQNPNVYAYDMSQVIPNCVPQGYQGQINYNQIRPASQVINQPQFYYQPQYTASFPQHQSQINQFGYTQGYIPAQQYTYAHEPVNTAPVNYTPTNRKSSPLVVVDPTNKTDLDLSKFQNHVVTERKGKGLLEVSQLEIKGNLQPLEEKKLENILEDSKENAIEGIYNHEECIEIISKDIIEVMQCPATGIEVDTGDALCEDTSEVVVEKTVVAEEEMSQETVEEATKIESSPESEDIEGENNEEVTSSDKDDSNYFPPIDKKESDATTLRRKLIYDREYLITIKSNYLSQKKPLNFPPIGDFSEEIIYNESQNISCKKPENHYPNSNIHTKKQNQKYPSNNYQKFTKPLQKLITLNHNAVPVLERLKSSYLPPQLRSKDQEINPQNELRRSIKCNLNKITPQNFQDCLSEISKLNIKEKDEMSCLINEIFIKAVQEEAYSVTYAQFCNRLALIYTDTQTFKGQLLKKCQDMFQTPIQDQLDSVRKEWMLKIDNESDLKLKNLYESDLEEQVKKAKDKYFGNIRFIGELFLHHLLAGRVILNCIIELLKGSNDSDALLALCKLMETCGKQVDERHKDHMNNFFRTMNELSKSTELETRIRFKLKDIIDMRKRNWVLRHIQQEKKINPKTLEEQKEEALAEAALAASKLVASQTTNKKQNKTVQHNSVRRQMSVPQKSISVKSLTFTSHTVDNLMVLGPSRSNWTAGSGAKPKPREVEEWTSLNQAKFATANSRSREQSPQVKIKNKYVTLESSEDASGNDSRPNSPPVRYPANITKAYRIKRDVKLSMSDDERSDIIFNDVMLTGLFDIDNFNKITNVQRIIEKWIDDMMEKDINCRRNIGDSFSKLIHNNSISYDLLAASFQTFVSNHEDLICDIPKLWDFLAQFLERFICDKNSNISFIESIFREILPNENVAHCISLTLHSASSRLGHNIVGQVFHKSSLKWDRIVPSKWEQFVEDNDLHFTVVGGAPLSRFGGYSLLSIADELQLMLSKDMINEDLFRYLETHVDKPTWKSCECSRTITSCILKAMPKKPIERARSYLNAKFEIIKLVSQSKIENEIEVLKSVLNVSNDFDYETLTAIYDVILTQNIVSEKALTLYLEDTSLKSESNFDVTYSIISQLYR